MRRAEALIAGIATRPERRDDVAYLLGRVAYAAMEHGLTTELGPRLLTSCQAVLLVDLVKRRITDAALRAQLDATLARIPAQSR